MTLNPNRPARIPKSPSPVRIARPPWKSQSSTNDPAIPEPVMNPRARTVAPGGMSDASIVQPAGTRVPLPTLDQSTPLVETSNATLQTSGAVPPVNRVMVEPARPKALVAGYVLLSRP